MTSSNHVLIASVFLLTGCVSYQSRPLLSKPEQLESVDDIVTKYRLDPKLIVTTDGLGLDEIAAAAVINNPKLKEYRLNNGLVKAQSLALSLLPDPQLSSSFDYPKNNSLGVVTATSVGLAIDINAILTKASMENKGKDLALQSDLALLWQEWQVIVKIKMAAVDFLAEKNKLALSLIMISQLEELYRVYDAAQTKHASTLAQTGIHLKNLIDSKINYGQLKLRHEKTKLLLNKMLGISPDADINLSEQPMPVRIDDKTMSSLVSRLSVTRPDLLALKAGYDAQEASVRASILAQFPSFNLGITSTSDNSGLKTQGFNIGVNLPLLNGNRANIAIERATRDFLAAEYQNRLKKSEYNVNKMQVMVRSIENELALLNETLASLSLRIETLKKAMQRGDINVLEYSNEKSSLFKRELERINLRASLLKTHIALSASLMLTKNQ